MVYITYYHPQVFIGNASTAARRPRLRKHQFDFRRSIAVEHQSHKAGQRLEIVVKETAHFGSVEQAQLGKAAAGIIHGQSQSLFGRKFTKQKIGFGKRTRQQNT